MKRDYNNLSTFYRALDHLEWRQFHLSSPNGHGFYFRRGHQVLLVYAVNPTRVQDRVSFGASVLAARALYSSSKVVPLSPDTRQKHTLQHK